MHSYPITLWQRITKLVASVYIKLSSGDNKPLRSRKSWEKYFQSLNGVWNWPTVWNTILLSPNNLAY